MGKSEETENRSLGTEEIIESDDGRKKSSRDFRNGMIAGVLCMALIATGLYSGKMLYDLMKMRREGVAAASNAAGEDSFSNTVEKMQVIEEAIDDYYFYGSEVSEEDIHEGVYRGMIAALGDPYSEYYSKEELEEVVNSNKGISYGIGAMISMNKQTNMAMISGLIEESPALAAGLREGDIIYEVDDESTQGLSLTQVVSLVKGREGTTVHLTIYREGENDFLEFDIERGKLIETTTVQSGMLEDTNNIGYLQIREFDSVTVDQYAEALAELKANDMEGLILDLRSNPGGDLAAVVEIAGRILPDGLIVYTEDKDGNKKEYTSDDDSELEVPLVVLVNEYSASASEILAGAIQDYNKGTLIGTTTYGKGIVQRIHRLNDGTALKLTVSAYFTPSGRNIHGVGIEPDIELEYDYDMAEEGIDNQVERAIEVLEGKIG